jgi:hypothetical protein
MAVATAAAGKEITLRVRVAMAEAEVAQAYTEAPR